ncbi:carbohydrate binding domain-containing protein [Flavobacterium sp.]|uniref:carbohydrate binding domain-containing protein n=1 Tax=Flavobacterium sp. TaxID=239 RepID=UPI003C552D22
MKKSIKIIVPALLVFFAIGCNNQDYITPSTYADAGFYSTYGKGTYKSSAVDNYITFQDISQGAIYHTWEIEEGNELLKGPISQQAKTYEQYIANPGQTKTDEKTINVLFKVGNTTSKIRMFDVFNEPVTFRRGPADIYANNPGGNVDAVLHTEGEWAGKYVLDLTIIVDVFDNVVPDLSLTQNGTIIDHKQEGVFIDIKVGESITLKDLSALVPNTSRPDNRTWKFINVEDNTIITSSQLEVVNVSFKKLGTYKATLTASRTATPNTLGSSTTYEIPIQFRVIKSDQPYVQTGAIKTLIDGTIQVPFSSFIEPGFPDQNSFFTVKVNGSPVIINSVTLNATNQSILDVKINGQLFPADVVTISYAGGNIQSTDARDLVAFTDKAVANYDTNFLGTEAGGFEDTFGNTWKATTNTSVTAPPGPITYSTEQKRSGLYSLKAVTTGAQRARFESSGTSPSKLFNLIKGITYTIKYSRYVTAATTATGEKAYLSPGTGTPINTTNQNFTLKDQWQDFEFDFVPTADINGGYFYFQLNPGEATVYYDNFYIAAKSVRP